MMCNTCTYRYIEILIFSFNNLIQYWLLGVLIHWNGQFSRPIFFPICVILYLKAIIITLIDFFYYFFTITTKQNIYSHFISFSIIISNITILYRIMIFLPAIRILFILLYRHPYCIHVCCTYGQVTIQSLL